SCGAAGAQDFRILQATAADVGKKGDFLAVYDRTVDNLGNGFNVIFYFNRDTDWRSPPRMVGCQTGTVDPIVSKMTDASKQTLLWVEVSGNITEVSPGSAPHVAGGRPDPGAVWMKDCSFKVVNWQSR